MLRWYFTTCCSSLKHDNYSSDGGLCGAKWKNFASERRNAFKSVNSFSSVCMYVYVYMFMHVFYLFYYSGESAVLSFINWLTPSGAEQSGLRGPTTENQEAKQAAILCIKVLIAHGDDDIASCFYQQIFVLCHIS